MKDDARRFPADNSKFPLLANHVSPSPFSLSIFGVPNVISNFPFNTLPYRECISRFVA